MEHPESNDLVSTLRLITAVHVISNPEQWYAKYLLGSKEQNYLDLVTLCSRIDFNGTETGASNTTTLPH